MNIVHTCIHIIDYIFPPSSDALIVQALNVSDVHKLYTSTYIDGIRALTSYKNQRVRALIHEAKFHHNERAYTLLGMLMTRYFEETTGSLDNIVPIPLSGARLRARGYNQVQEVLKRATIPPHIHIRTDILVRKIHTKPQTELTRSERLLNVRDAFGIADVTLIKDKHILIVDDVLTTGATLRAAKATLLPHGAASVTCIAFAH